MAHQHSVLLFVQLAELARRDQIVEILRGLPGVIDVDFPGSAEAGPTLEGTIRVGYDPDQTDTITIERTLADRGFTVLSAREETPPHEH